MKNNCTSQLKYIFVHGAGGWGEYDAVNRYLPYWGMFSGDLIAYLNERGYECYAASVAPGGSVWVRACELYAQLAGKQTDYGQAYSEKEHCARYGPDFTGRALIPEWNDEVRLVLIGHSMGGNTVRLLAHLLAHGDEKERSRTPADEISSLFTGKKGDRVHTVVTLASPHNGSGNADMINDPSFDRNALKIPLLAKLAMKILSLRLKTGKRSAAGASYVSSIDRTLAQNEGIDTLKHVWYFSIPCSSTRQMSNGTHMPDRNKTEILYFARAVEIGAYQGVTPEGYQIGKEWRENDGLVSTFSARAPLHAPQADISRSRLHKGMWNIMPVFDGDHMSVQGGFFHKKDVRGYYLNLLEMIERLP